MLGENIYRLRKLKNLSQEQLAFEVGVTRQTISNWELGETSPNPEQLKLLSKALHVSIDELLNNDIKNILEEKVSNTEKLAGMIIKILKFIGISFLIMLIIDIIALIIFSVVRTTSITKSSSSVSLKCFKDNTPYLINIGSDGYFNCSNCNERLKEDLKEIVDYVDLGNNEKIILNYFQNNNGACE